MRVDIHADDGRSITLDGLPDDPATVGNEVKRALYAKDGSITEVMVVAGDMDGGAYARGFFSFDRPVKEAEVVTMRQGIAATYEEMFGAEPEQIVLTFEEV
jgi:hypothetical protein